jgi:hypothetical protein
MIAPPVHASAPQEARCLQGCPTPAELNRAAAKLPFVLDAMAGALRHCISTLPCTLLLAASQALRRPLWPLQLFEFADQLASVGMACYHSAGYRTGP